MVIILCQYVEYISVFWYTDASIPVKKMINMIHRVRKVRIKGETFYIEVSPDYRYVSKKIWEAQAKRKKKKPQYDMIKMIDRSKSGPKD